MNIWELNTRREATPNQLLRRRRFNIPKTKDPMDDYDGHESTIPIFKYMPFERELGEYVN